MHESRSSHGAARGVAWLFDVDGTLLTTEGAATEAFSGAVADAFGIHDDLDGVAFAGRIEPQILADILARHGIELDHDGEARFWNAVFDRARRLLVPPRGRLMPGVPRIVDRVSERPHWVAGLLTGNMTQMAAIKLKRFGIERCFAFGAFGEMAESRDALARLAVQRIESGYGIPAAHCIVIGDTEHDIACARAAGAWAVAVATGSRPRETLAAHGPDLLLADLTDPAPLLELAGRIEAGEAQPAE